MKTQRMIYNELELISDSETLPDTKRLLKNWLGRLWHSLVMSITQSPQIRVRQSHDRAGNCWWSVYDPATGRSACLASEAEVIAWIEHNHYPSSISHDQHFNYFR